MNRYTPIRIEAAKAVLRGAICGAVIGSPYESYFTQTKRYDFPMFTRSSRITDDTVCSIAVAEALICDLPFAATMRKWCRRYPHAGYGGNFKRWIFSDTLMAYGSFGNGSAMRVSAVGAIAASLEECLVLAKQSAIITHNHPEGIKGAQAVAVAIYMALRGALKYEIKQEIENRFHYHLSRNYSDIQRCYKFDASCQKSVPEAIICFLQSFDYESAVRRAIALGGDADTQASIAGAIAAAYYGEIPAYIRCFCMKRLPEEMRVVFSRFDLALEERHGAFNRSQPQ